ncbi:transglutaminase [Antarcticibacterium sp. 1MA-6-2]|uniref:transglutaminase n=1 Tax=Antarcticibacterium sp. 1MA-6-2 TaxID=2908210 RepID=UPI001F249AD2|nr:transglutaminase [Antarcticibacterium sp. 1MA-6-2]UJH92762.1 transglutaminase [Antarcticibacterium sp. 1MA-6-2]
MLQYTIPINKLEASVSIPEFLGFKKHFNLRSPLTFTINESSKNFSFTSLESVVGRGGSIKSSTGTSQVQYNQHIYSIEKENIPALKREAFVDYVWNYAAVLKWELQFTKFPNSLVENYTETWENVSKSIYVDSYGKELGRTGYFDKDLDQILSGVTDHGKKASLIYNFVKTKIKWNGYAGFIAENGGAKAYKEGEGNVADINLALASMLKYAGLKSYPVLLSTKDNGIPLFPTRKGFNYIVTAVEVGENVFLLDATDENNAFGDLPERARNWHGRILIDKEASDWISLMPAQQSKNRLQISYQFDESLKIQGKTINVINGYYAKTFRDNYKNVNKDSYLETLEKGKGNIVISELEMENEIEVGTDIKQTYTFELENGMERINDKIYLTPLLFLAEKENPFKAEKREYPIFFYFPSLENKTVNILLPEGYEVEFLPESAIIDLNNGAGTFKFITLQNGNYLRIESEYNMKNTVYPPADYKSLKDFFAEVVNKHSEAIVLKRI